MGGAVFVYFNYEPSPTKQAKVRSITEGQTIGTGIGTGRGGTEGTQGAVGVTRRAPRIPEIRTKGDDQG